MCSSEHRERDARTTAFPRVFPARLGSYELDVIALLVEVVDVFTHDVLVGTGRNSTVFYQDRREYWRLWYEGVELKVLCANKEIVLMMFRE